MSNTNIFCKKSRCYIVCNNAMMVVDAVVVPYTIHMYIV